MPACDQLVKQIKEGRETLVTCNHEAQDYNSLADHLVDAHDKSQTEAGHEIRRMWRDRVKLTGPLSKQPAFSETLLPNRDNKLAAAAREQAEHNPHLPTDEELNARIKEFKPPEPVAITGTKEGKRFRISIPEPGAPNGGRRCRRCQQVGHRADKCPGGQPAPIGEYPRACANCRERGHQARDCTNPRHPLLEPEKPLKEILNRPDSTPQKKPESVALTRSSAKIEELGKRILEEMDPDKGILVPERALVKTVATLEKRTVKVRFRDTALGESVDQIEALERILGHQKQKALHLLKKMAIKFGYLVVPK